MRIAWSKKTGLSLSTSVSAAVCVPRLYATIWWPDRHDLWTVSPAFTHLGLVFVSHGVEPFQWANCQGIRLGVWRCPEDDQPIACWDCGEKKSVKLNGQVESDEVYIRTEYKGHPAIVAHEKRKGRRRKLRGNRGRDTLAGERPPVLGMIQRNGEVFIQMMPNVQQATIQPIIEVHVNTIEGFWSLLRSWLRPHRGVSQENLPLYLAFFEFLHNARRRVKVLLHSLIAALLAPWNRLRAISESQTSIIEEH